MTLFLLVLMFSNLSFVLEYSRVSSAYSSSFECCVCGSISCRSCHSADMTITNRYGDSGQPCLMPAFWVWYSDCCFCKLT